MHGLRSTLTTAFLGQFLPNLLMSIVTVEGVALRQKNPITALGDAVENLFHLKRETPSSTVEEGKLREALERLTVSDECRATVEDCLNRAQGEHCHDDALDCVKDALFGPDAAPPNYSDLGPDLDVAELLTHVAAEVRLQNGDTAAKRALSSCMTSEKNIWRALYDKVVTAIKPTTLNTAHDFVCGVLLGEDSGTYVDQTVYPPQCNYKEAKALCQERVPRPSLGTLFTKWHPQLRSGSGSTTQTLNTFSDCWDNADRGECIAAVMLGGLCDGVCEMANCVIRQLRASQAPGCVENLNKALDEFLLSSTGQCRSFATELKASKPIEKCPNPFEDTQKAGSSTRQALGTFFLFLSFFVHFYVF